MKTRSIFSKAVAGIVTAISLATVAVSSTAQTPTGIKNIVIVHGAFADASGWEPVYHLLVKDGYTVSLVQNPTSSLSADTAATNAAVQRMNGPVLLVGHSWGGTVITEAGSDPKVKALVYVCAFIPDSAESTLDLTSHAKPLPVQGILNPDAKGNVYLGESTFQETFTPGQGKAKSEFMYASQIPLTVKAFTDKVTIAAWKSKPVYAIKPSNDGTISPSLEDMMYLIYKPAEAFIGTFPEGEPALVKPSERARIIQHHNVVIRVELDAESRQNVGMLAEYYVWQKFIHGEPSFIALLGLETSQARGVRWYNEGRLIDPSIPDQSVGKGHDLYLEAEDMAIEVKGMIGDTAFVSITGPEFSCMREKGDRYALVIVKHLLKGNDIKTIVILNPYAEIISGNLRFLESKLIIPG